MSLHAPHPPITVAVIGHTNTGKTSLMRTLLRDPGFGEVNDAAGTTRHAESGGLYVGSELVIELTDTPGLEDSMGLLDALENLSEVPADARSSGPELLAGFLSESTLTERFEQEAKVIRQLRRANLVFYVIDAREPLLGKYRDELRLIQMSAKPVIPVLNFSAMPTALTAQWTDLLARHQLHATVVFDNVIFRFEDEKKLLQKMQSLMPARHERLQELIDARSREWSLLIHSASERIADLLIGMTAIRTAVNSEHQDLSQDSQELQARVRQAENHCLKELLHLFGFQAGDIRLETLPVQQGQWSRDLFDAHQLRKFGLEAGSDAAKGAAIGAGLDLAVGGMSLGAASALGALGGMLWRTGKRFGKEWTARFRDEHYLCVDDATLKHLWFRQKELLSNLQHRGHASVRHSTIHEKSGAALPDNFPRWLRQIRSNPEWSAHNSPDEGRTLIQREIARTLREELEAPV